MAKTTQNDIIKTDVAGVCQGFIKPDNTTVVMLDPVFLKSLEFIKKNWEPRFDYNKSKPKKDRKNKVIEKTVGTEEPIKVKTQKVGEVAKNTPEIQDNQQGIEK